MKVGIIGSGDVGKALGTGFVKKGHEARIGTRDAQKLIEWKEKNGPRASVGSFADAAAYGEVVVLATLWSGTQAALKMAGEDNLRDKVLIDTTNPLAFGQGLPQLAVGHTDSGGEQVQRWAPSSRVVKCFNIVGNAHMVDPDFPGGPPDMFICGNDAEAKQKVTGILTEFGWPALDIGGIEGSRLLEPMCLLWVAISAQTKSPKHAFKLLRK